MTLTDADPEILSKGEQTRRAILDAAIVRFGREGFRATSVADIARDAEVSGTAAYAYFDGKEDLFLTALDDDAAAAVEEGMALVFSGDDDQQWRASLMFALVAAVQEHPLARRVLANLEPDVTDRVIDLPAIAHLRSAVAEKLAAEQLEGTVRRDIDPVVIGSGIVSILLSLLMTIIQLGGNVPTEQAANVIAVLEAALDRSSASKS